MSRKPLPYSTPVHKDADLQLLEIRRHLRNIQLTEDALAAEMTRLKQSSPLWQNLEANLMECRERLMDTLKDLETLVKDQLAVLFPGAAGAPPLSLSVDLPHGSLLYGKIAYVVKSPKTLKLLLKYGFEQVLRLSWAVDWDGLADVQEWPDEVLAIIGTRRAEKETLEWTVPGEQGQAVSGRCPVKAGER